jgi:hypothetical protein
MKGHPSLILGSLDFNKHLLNLKICMLDKDNEHLGIDHQGCKVH